MRLHSNKWEEELLKVTGVGMVGREGRWVRLACEWCLENVNVSDFPEQGRGGDAEQLHHLSAQNQS